MNETNDDGAGFKHGTLFTSVGPGTVHEEFTVQPAAAGGLEAVTAALARKLASLAAGPGQHNVTVEAPGPVWPFYTQTMVDSVDGAWVEAVSNEFIHPDSLLDDDQQARLVAIGFEPSGASPNYSVRLAAPVDWDRVALLMLAPHVGVYGVRPDEPVTVSVSPHHHL